MQQSGAFGFSLEEALFSPAMPKAKQLMAMQPQLDETEGSGRRLRSKALPMRLDVSSADENSDSAEEETPMPTPRVQNGEARWPVKAEKLVQEKQQPVQIEHPIMVHSEKTGFVKFNAKHMEAYEDLVKAEETPIKLGKAFTLSNKRKKSEPVSRVFSRLDFSTEEVSGVSVDTGKLDSDKVVQMLQQVQEFVRQQNNMLKVQSMQAERNAEKLMEFKGQVSQVKEFEEQIAMMKVKYEQDMEETVGKQKMELAKVKRSLGEFKQWTEKVEAAVALELEDMAKRNAELQVIVEMQRLRLEPLQILEQQMLAQEEISLSAVLMKEGEVSILKQQLALVAQEMWQKTKERMRFVIKYPYEVLKAGLVHEVEAQLLKEVEELQKERDYLKQQVQQMEENKRQQLAEAEKKEENFTNSFLRQDVAEEKVAEEQIDTVIADRAQEVEMGKADAAESDAVKEAELVDHKVNDEDQSKEEAVQQRVDS
ncbi:hypothetical protein GOP47_0021414 [Adiantum capillus-veneris]|uniref:Uncharacterized protein n=1 Tax=Adiantum capillus-veneris TaxID=13818 RepID=A0A9D4U7P9_ADICA|nr:hypothetical protein GOP47_0021414 [Adiantum capillus-veneris]